MEKSVAETNRKRRSPESWGAIRKLPSGRFQASYLGPDGTRWTARTDSNQALTFGARIDARAWLTKTHAAIQRGEWESPDARAERLALEAKAAESNRFGIYAAAWVDQRRSGKGDPLRPKTATEYRRQLERGLSEFNDDPLPAITPARVRSWHARRAKTAPTAAGAEARLLRAILNTALVDGIVTSNPVPANLTRTTTGRKHRPPTIEELAIILDAIAPRFRLAVLLAAYGGLRLSEWRALRRCDLVRDGERYVIHVERQAQHIKGEWIVGPPKSAEGERDVPMPKAATPDINGHLDEHVGPFPADLVFPPTGRSLFLHDRQFNDAWHKALSTAGARIPIEWDEDGEAIRWENIVREHDLRAFAGTLHARSGATLRETMVFLGHSTTVAAMAYQATTGRDAELADRMPMPKAPRATNPAIGDT